MTQQQSNDLWLEDILREEMPYVSDEGFTQKILNNIETKNKNRARILLFLWLVSGSGFFYLLFNYFAADSLNGMVSVTQFVIQTFTTTPSLMVAATGSVIMLLFLFIKTEV